MKLRILTPARKVLEAEVTQVTLPGTLGQLTPMTGHDLLLTPLKAGLLSFPGSDSGGKAERQNFTIGSGVAEIVRDAVTVFTSSAAKPTTVD